MKNKLFTFFALMTVTFACDDWGRGPKTYVGNVRLVHQEDVKKWAKKDFEVVVGDLWLGGCNGCVDGHDDIYSTIEDISGLKNLKRISGKLSILNASSLGTLDGLHNLSVVGELYIEDCYNLNSYDALNRLDSVDGDFSLWGNGKITNLESFKRLISVKGRLHIHTHRELSEINGFSQLRSVGSIDFEFNHKLLTINGFSGLEKIETDLRIRSNSELKDFCSLTNAVTNGPLEGTFLVSGNAYNPTRSDIINGNCSQ